MKTIAQQLNVTDFPFKINNKNGGEIYHEFSNGFWDRSEYDSDGRVIYYEDSNEDWVKREYNSKGNEIYFENSTGYWYKREFDLNGKVIYFENAIGKIIDDRPKTEVQKALELLEKEGMLVDGKIIKN